MLPFLYNSLCIDGGNKICEALAEMLYCEYCTFLQIALVKNCLSAKIAKGGEDMMRRTIGRGMHRISQGERTGREASQGLNISQPMLYGVATKLLLS